MIALETELDGCGCCEGVERLTPASVENAPGLSALVYRVGTHARFKASLQAELSRRPALNGLTTRADDDASLALLDAGAAMLDVLTFYQERIANEGYLRTATERRSLLELARAIGYELRPGVAAETYLAFTLEDAPGAPGVATIEAGTKVQSIPSPGETPQTFETVETIHARAEWNVLRPQQTTTPNLSADMDRVWLRGANWNLKEGDMLLVSGATFTRVRRVLRAEANYQSQRTEVVLDSAPNFKPEKQNLAVSGVWALRVKAAPFGHSAPRKTQVNPATGEVSFPEWTLSETPYFISLDGQFDQIRIDSYAVIGSPHPFFGYDIYRVKDVDTNSRATYGTTGRVTRLNLDKDWIRSWAPDISPVRRTVVYAGSEELELAEAPLEEPLCGEEIALSQVAPGLGRGQALAVTGKRMRVRLVKTATSLKLVSADGSKQVAITLGDTLQVFSAPELLPGGTTGPKVLTPEQLMSTLKSSTPQPIRWRLIDRDGFVGHLTAASDQVTIQPADSKDPTVNEVVVIGHVSTAVSADRDRTTITLHAPLQNCYDRETVTLNANIVPSTHGETRREVLGSGDASLAFQTFTLKQMPLTYVQAATLSGGRSSLQVRVNDLLWHEVPSLYGHGSKERVYLFSVKMYPAEVGPRT